MIPTIYRVQQFCEEYPGTFSLRVVPRDGSPVADFQPGQFNMLYPFGAGESAISLSGATGDNTGYTHTIRRLGAVTQQLEGLREGDELGLRGPFGRGWPLAELTGKDVVIVAGGLGLAPLRPLIYQLLRDDSPTASCQLFYGARSPEEMLYRAQLQDWAEHIRVATTVDRAGSQWQGNIGVVTNLLGSAGLNPDNCIACVCGPEIMMRFSIQALLKQGLPASAIFLSMERNMQCATGHCGHCQWGPKFICRDGPVFCYEEVQQWFYLQQL